MLQDRRHDNNYRMWMYFAYTCSFVRAFYEIIYFFFMDQMCGINTHALWPCQLTWLFENNNCWCLSFSLQTNLHGLVKNAKIDLHRIPLNRREKQQCYNQDKSYVFCHLFSFLLFKMPYYRQSQWPPPQVRAKQQQSREVSCGFPGHHTCCLFLADFICCQT